MAGGWPAGVLAQGLSAPCVYTADNGSIVITDRAADPRCAHLLPKPDFRAPANLRMTRSVADLMQLAHEASVRHRVDHRLVESLVEMESAYDPYAVSRKGAAGLMQLMPSVAQQFGVLDPFDAAQNLDAGVRYLRGLLVRYGGDLEHSLAAYNAGPGAVDRYSGVPPYRETRDYVRRVLYRYRQRLDGLYPHGPD